MPKIVITHSVVDIDNWLKGKSERAEAIGSIGGSNIVDHVANDGTNTIAISADIDDVDGALATMASPPPEMAAGMERHGVIPPWSSTSRGSHPAAPRFRVEDGRQNRHRSASAVHPA